MPPVCIRPSVDMDGASNEDDITMKIMVRGVSRLWWREQIVAAVAGCGYGSRLWCQQQPGFYLCGMCLTLFPGLHHAKRPILDDIVLCHYSSLPVQPYVKSFLPLIWAVCLPAP